MPGLRRGDASGAWWHGLVLLQAFVPQGSVHTHGHAVRGPRHMLNFQKAVRIIFLSRGYSSMKFCEDELRMNKSVTARWNRHLRQVVAEALAGAPVQLGRPSRIMELDESLLTRSKYNRGKRYPQKWVFGGTTGGITFQETGDAFVVPVEDRSSLTLLPIIHRHVKAGTT
ncbi:hypothetical protein M513_09005 [Trichuris suis]|uniref:ISXO2-like transposase domain-containing protein n=1 Tax=Trichuris suis TaxID=68888 RepID=A0A085LYJ9_9BILA|nr:hypothetical protein M513_09005 [Trichuris suis]